MQGNTIAEKTVQFALLTPTIRIQKCIVVLNALQEKYQGPGPLHRAIVTTVLINFNFHLEN